MIVEDVHNACNLDLVEEAIRREAPDQIVFLGDYFDKRGDNPEDALRAAAWLKESLTQPNRVHLWGNHDLAYAYPENELVNGCSGFTAEKCAAISSIIGPDDLAQLQLSFWVGPRCLLTHAGWSDRIARPLGAYLPEFLQREEEAAWTALYETRKHWIWDVGRVRNSLTGTPAGGLVWCDLQEFSPIPGLDQIFGHTTSTDGLFKQGPDSRNWCLDTARHEGVRHYLIWDGVAPTTHWLDGEPTNRWCTIR